MKNILMTIEYDGTNFSGWQRQPDKRTVQGELEKALSIVCGEDIKIDGTSRTDAGVHALGQRATFSGNFKIPTERIMLAANNILSGGKGRLSSDIRIVDIKEVPNGFHARFDSKGKTYIYKIVTCLSGNTFGRNHCCMIKDRLDVGKMQEAANYIIGTKDFKSFQASGGTEKETTVRTIWELEVLENERPLKDTEYGPQETVQEITIRVKGDGFLYNMVRIITGTLVEVGLGKKNPIDLIDIIESKDRSKAGYTAPPEGLYLKEIYY